MRSTTLRIAAAAIGSAMVLGVSATAASAAPAAFSTTGALTLTKTSPTLVIKIGTTPTPATTVTCANAPSWQTRFATNIGLPVQGKMDLAMSVMNCVTGTGLSAAVVTAETTNGMLANKSGSVYSLSGTDHWYMSILVGGNEYLSSPGYAPASYSAGWLNNPIGASTLTFNNAPVGRVAPGYPLVGQPITLTGTFSVTKGGSPITLI